MLDGFKKFLMRGNVIDLAAAVIIGAAFGAIIDSLVKDIITPMIGMLGGQPDFSALKVGSIGIGNFINAVVSFLIKAAALYFVIIIPFNRISARLAAAPAPAPPPPPPSPSEAYLKEIRDLLAKR
jgi:large conductance mechanosensitive channel